MKPSEVDFAVLREYLRLPDTGEDATLEAIRSAAWGHIRSRTGLDDQQIDGHEDLAIALLVLCAELYDNRQMSTQSDKVNPVIEQILAAHAVNLL